jgi:hypothetical protein
MSIQRSTLAAEDAAAQIYHSRPRGEVVQLVLLDVNGAQPTKSLPGACGGMRVPLSDRRHQRTFHVTEFFSFHMI